jgi:Tol biopolymer transport system component
VRRPALGFHEITFLGNAYRPEISPDGDFLAFVTREKTGEQALMIQDIASGDSREIIRAHIVDNLKWRPDSGELSFVTVTPGKGRAVFRVSRFLGSPRQMDSREVPWAWSPDGSQFIDVNLREKRIRTIEAETGKSQFIPLDWPFLSLTAVDWSPSAPLLVLLTTDSDGRFALWTIGLDGQNQNKTFESSAPLLCPRWSPSGDAIYFLQGNARQRELWRLPVSRDAGRAKKPAELILGGHQIGESFSLSRDGRRLYFTKELRYSNLARLALDNSGPANTTSTIFLTTGTLEDRSPNISPDGMSIAFSRGDGRTSNVFVMPLQGGAPRPITFLKSFNSHPVWSPDGREVAFVSDEAGFLAVWKADVQGGNPVPLSTSPVSVLSDSPLSWSPGHNILFHCPGNRNFSLLNPVTREETLLIGEESVGWIFNPAYSPDGLKVGVNWNRLSSEGLWLISLRDSSHKYLNMRTTFPLRWSPDGQWIYAAQHVSDKVKIVMVRAEGGGTQDLFDMPVGLEGGQVDYSGMSMAPDGKTYVFSVGQSISDIWMAQISLPDAPRQQDLFSPF